MLGCLRCPVCGDELAMRRTAVRCPAGHSFDIARHGYVNLLSGDVDTGTADAPDMVAARAEFLAGGHFGALARRVADRAARSADPGRTPGGCVLDIGSGTGYYLRAVLDRLPGAVGIALDLSKYALRRAARAHPRAGAVAWDAWRPFPVRSGVASLILNVFAPRNGSEFLRVLRPGGTLIVVSPTNRHLGELIGPLSLLTVDERKPERLTASLGPRFTEISTETYEVSLRLSRRETAALAAMGPSARHGNPAKRSALLAALPEPVAVTASFRLAVYRAPA